MPLLKYVVEKTKKKTPHSLYLYYKVSKLLSTPCQSTMGYKQAHILNNCIHVFECYMYDRIHNLVLSESYILQILLG